MPPLAGGISSAVARLRRGRLAMYCKGPSSFQTSLPVMVVCTALIWSNLCEAHTNVARWKRQSCSDSDSFKCKSGECIANFSVCDGEVNCQDASDETAEICKSIRCPSHTLRCKYGACIDSRTICNGKKECADGSDEVDCHNGGTSVAVRRSCKGNRFECSSGSCLDPFLVCDGIKDCDDGSDETSKVCGSLKCPHNSFQCKYGACIDRHGKCNDIVQCADGSDEVHDLCGSKPTTTTTTPATPPFEKCVLPEQPANGKYQVGGCKQNSCPFKPGSEVNPGTVIIYTCEGDFKLAGAHILLCEQGWSSAIPTCGKVFCPALAMPSRIIECQLDGNKADCAKQMASGTKASVRCNTWYDNPQELASFNTVCGESGQWSRPVTPCIPKCGMTNPDGVPFIANGVAAKRGEFPWHVAIYLRDSDGKMQPVCGGSIISSYSIVTAAHCFWNASTNKQADPKDYRVLVGKYFLDWNNRAKNEDIQELDIVKINIPGRYMGEVHNYAYDIAVVIVNVEIRMTIAVRPVCIDYEKKFTYFFTPGKSGSVVGWGYTENYTLSDSLRAVKLPHIDLEVCQMEVPQTFLPFITFDKFCAGYRNGTSVCKGDSGGGYATEFRDGKWYLMGIVSVGVPATKLNCNFFQYTTFTRVPEYYDFIRQLVNL